VAETYTSMSSYNYCLAKKEMEKEWKSPRRIAEEDRAYRHRRFESYMRMADRGELSRELAIQALREEIIYENEYAITETTNEK